MANISNKKFASNVVVSLLAQIISLMVGFIINLVVPKFIDGYNYSYWQTFILYSSYVGVLHFGLLDGFVLRYSKYDYDQLDKPIIRSQFQILLIFNALLMILGIIISSFIFEGVTLTIVILVSITVVTKNALTYSSYTFQITNRINKYAYVVILQRVIYCLLVLIFLIFNVRDFYWICICEIIAEIITFIVSTKFNKGLYFGKVAPFKTVLSELKTNVCAGIMLMLANWSAILIINGAKTVIQLAFDILTFGKVVFAFTVSNVFLTFITAISVVLFPSLKRLDEDKLPSLYKTLRNILSPILLGCLLLYFPGCLILQAWLPKYSESLIYLGILLPIIVYSSKVNLLTNTYLKAYRKERSMLIVNLLVAILGIIAFVIFAFVLHNLTAVLISIIAVIMINAIASEIIVLKIIKQRIIFDFIIEILLTVIFIVSVSVFDFWIAFTVYAVSYVIYLIINYKSIKTLLSIVIRRRKV